jgi:hypothetical protein
MEHFWYTNVVFWPRGSGKTYYFVREAYKAHIRGEIVISNVWLNFPHIRFRKTKDLIPIMKEIAEYNFYEVTPIIAPTSYLKAHGMKRKKWEAKRFFILWDEIWIHLNHRNWAKNFKEEFLHDMIMEPRKYWLTIVGICQNYKTVDVEFLKLANNWFGVRKWGIWWFESVFITEFYVTDWELRLDNLEVISKKRNWHYFQKKKDLSDFFWWLYYTREIQGVGSEGIEGIPNLFKKWDIFDLSIPLSPLKDKVPEMSEANMGVGGSPPEIISPYNNPFDIWWILNLISSEEKKEPEKSYKKKWRKQKQNLHSHDETDPIVK